MLSALGPRGAQTPGLLAGGEHGRGDAEHRGRADVAHFMATALTEDAWLRSAPFLAY